MTPGMIDRRSLRGLVIGCVVGALMWAGIIYAVGRVV